MALMDRPLATTNHLLKMAVRRQMRNLKRLGLGPRNAFARHAAIALQRRPFLLKAAKPYAQFI